jgi:hypothetical protein
MENPFVGVTKIPSRRPGIAEPKYASLLIERRYAQMNRPVFWGFGIMSMMMNLHKRGVHIAGQYTNLIQI